MRISATFGGHVELEKRLDALTAKMRRQTLIRALQVGGLPILKLMEQLAPFDTDGPPPHLKFEIVMMVLRSLDGVRTGEHDAAIAIGPSAKLRYEGFQEFGTANHPPQPYARPAWDQEGGDKAMRRVGDELFIAMKVAR